MKPAIQILAEKLALSRGLDYSLQLLALKKHLEGLDDVAYLAEIVRVSNPDIFRYLYSTGLSLNRMQIANARWKELTK